MYAAVRAAHPHLTTIPSEGGTSVAVCPHYPKLVAAVGGSGADRIVRMSLPLCGGEPEEGTLRLPYLTAEKPVKAAFRDALRQAFSGVRAEAVDGLLEIRTNRQQHMSPSVSGGGGSARVPYTHFVLRKRGIAWFAARRAIARHLRIPEEHVTCAGIKDKHGVTTQRCAARGVHADALAGLRWAADADGGGHGDAGGGGAGDAADAAIGDGGDNPSEPPQLLCSAFSYAAQGLTAGDLQGNKFSITLRGTGAGKEEAARVAAAEVAERGFPNYFGPQRFGLAPRERGAHVCAGIAAGDWAGAASALLSPVTADSPAAAAAKNAFAAAPASPGAWREALRLLPHGCAAERQVLRAMIANERQPARWLSAVGHCVVELWLHSMQSWVWNRVLRDRLRKHGAKVLAGDLILPRGSKGRPEVCSDPSGHDLGEVVHPKPGGGADFPQNDIAAMYDAALAPHGLQRDHWTGAKGVGVHLSADYRHILGRCSDAGVVFDGGDCTVVFTLPPSSYATVCLGAMMRTFLF